MITRGADVKTLRERMHLTQDQFAERFRFSIATLRQWEQERRQPSSSTINLLAIIERYPDIVEEVLSA